MKNLSKLVVLIAALALVVAACSDDGGDDTTTTAAASDDTTTTAAASDDTTTTAAASDDTTTTAAASGDVSEWGLPIIDPLDVAEGDVGIAGSSTVFPLSVAVIDQWIDEGGPQYAIDSIGSGGGFERFCVEGASDISNASRAIKDEQVEACRSNDRDPIEIRVGSDALSHEISSVNTIASE